MKLNWYLYSGSTLFHLNDYDSNHFLKNDITSFIFNAEENSHDTYISYYLRASMLAPNLDYNKQFSNKNNMQYHPCSMIM